VAGARSKGAMAGDVGWGATAEASHHTDKTC
jgi:hypothetical protein